jgi:hypothetical protein
MTCQLSSGKVVHSFGRGWSIILIKGVLTFTCLLPSIAFSEVADAKAARIMWSAFECATIAGIAGYDDKVENLFSVGYGAGKQFLAAAQAGTITDEEARSNVPIGVSLLLGGPSHDFIIGRVYESAMNGAFDEIVKEDAQGLTLEIKDWISDPELKASIAKTKFLQANCDIF